MLCTDLGELGIFGQESIAWVNRVGIGDLCRGYYIRNLKIRKVAGRWANTNGFIGEAHMQTLGIGSRVYCHGLNAHFLTGANNAQSDLTPVGN